MFTDYICLMRLWDHRGIDKATQCIRIYRTCWEGATEYWICGSDDLEEHSPQKPQGFRL